MIKILEKKKNVDIQEMFEKACEKNSIYFVDESVKSPSSPIRDTYSNDFKRKKKNNSKIEIGDFVKVYMSNSGLLRGYVLQSDEKKRGIEILVKSRVRGKTSKEVKRLSLEVIEKIEVLGNINNKAHRKRRMKFDRQKKHGKKIR